MERTHLIRSPHPTGRKYAHGLRYRVGDTLFTPGKLNTVTGNLHYFLKILKISRISNMLKTLMKTWMMAKMAMMAELIFMMAMMAKRDDGDDGDDGKKS